MLDQELENKEVVEEKEAEQADVNDLLPSGSPIEKPAEDARDYAEVIEEARQVFWKKYKTGRRNSYISMGVVMALAIGSVICITMSPMVLKIIGWSLIGVAVVGMLLYYILTRNQMPNATKEYIAIVNDQFNTRNFSDTRFSDVTIDKNEKVELSDPISDGIYQNLNNIASRNVVNGKFDGRTFRVADMGVYTGQGKNRQSAFVGKYMTYVNDLHFEGRYIITVKGKTPVDLPSDIEDLDLLINEGDFLVYGKSGNKPASDLNQKFLDKIKKIETNKHLLTYSVVIWGGHSSVYASYDDEIMTLPYEKPYNKAANEQYAHDLYSFYDALAMLNKKEK